MSFNEHIDAQIITEPYMDSLMRKKWITIAPNNSDGSEVHYTV